MLAVPESEAPRLTLRADANAQTGTGHVMRCLALAQAWQDAGGVAHFAAAELPNGLATRLEAESMALHRLDVVPGSHKDAVQVVALARNLGAAWIVIDGYHFDTAFQRTCKDAGLRLLAIDDNGHVEHYLADLVLNQNIYADASLYPRREPTTNLLLGTRYVLLRHEFWPWCGWQRGIPDRAMNILVTMGGSDPDNVTLKVIQALQQIEDSDLKIVVVVGGSNTHYPSLKVAIEAGGVSIRLRQNVTDMSKLMAWADLAISAAGSTCWELAFMGVPSLLLVLAENQERVATYLHKENVAVCLGSGKQADSPTIAINTLSLVSNPHLRNEMSSKGMNLVDGLGVQRVIMSLGAPRIEKGS